MTGKNRSVCLPQGSRFSSCALMAYVINWYHKSIMCEIEGECLMNYRYEMTFSDLEEALSNPAGIAIAGMGLLVAFVVLACFVVMYVFQSIGLYTIAKRRGLPTLALPGCQWPIPGFWAAFRTNINMWSGERSAIAGRFCWVWPLPASSWASQGCCSWPIIPRFWMRLIGTLSILGWVWADLPLLHWRDWWRQPWRFTNISACTMCTSPAIPRTVWSFWCYLWCFPF